MVKMSIDIDNVVEVHALQDTDNIDQHHSENQQVVVDIDQDKYLIEWLFYRKYSRKKVCDTYSWWLSLREQRGWCWGAGTRPGRGWVWPAWCWPAPACWWGPPGRSPGTVSACPPAAPATPAEDPQSEPFLQRSNIFIMIHLRYFSLVQDMKYFSVLTLNMVDIVDSSVHIKHLLPANRKFISNTVSKTLRFRQTETREMLGFMKLCTLWENLWTLFFCIFMSW